MGSESSIDGLSDVNSTLTALGLPNSSKMAFRPAKQTNEKRDLRRTRLVEGQRNITDGIPFELKFPKGDDKSREWIAKMYGQVKAFQGL